MDTVLMFFSKYSTMIEKSRFKNVAIKTKFQLLHEMLHLVISMLKATYALFTCNHQVQSNLCVYT